MTARDCRLVCGLSLALLSFVLGGACSSAGTDAVDAPTLLLPRAPTTLDPRFAADSVSLKVSRLLFSSLVTIDPQSLQVTPQLAQRVEQLSSTRYRATLRVGLRFHDGSPLDAQDVVATYRGLVDPALGSRYASTYRRIRSVRAEDATHVVFELDGPHATFLTDLEMPIVREEDARRQLPSGQGELVGSGPYALVHAGRGELLLRAVPQPGLKNALLPQVLLRAVRDDNIRAMRLRSGAGDMALDAVPPLLLPMFEGKEGFVVSSAPGVGTTYIGVNMEAEGLSDVRVRRAIAHAIDRERLVLRKLGGRGHPALGFVPKGHWAYTEELPHYAYDVQRARRLISEAGADGREIVLRCSSDRARVSMARAIAAMLRAAGLKVHVRPSELSSLMADLGRGRFELTLMELPEVLEPHVLSWFFDSSRIPGPGREGANRWHMNSAGLDAAFEAGRRAGELAERRRAYLRAQRILAQELPAIPLWHRDVVAVRRAGLPDLPTPRNGRYDGYLRP